MNVIKIPKRPRGMGPRQAFFNRIGNRLDVQAQNGTLDIDIYDEIGFFGVSALDIRERLKNASPSEINVRINSPGGDAFDGIAIYNDLVSNAAPVNVTVTGLAASAASIIAMAGDNVEIADNGFLMIHNAWGIVLGDRNDMADFSDLLGQLDRAIARTYVARTGIPLADVSEMMDAETWLDGEAAVEKGFADSTMGEADASAAFDLSIFDNVPADLKRRTEECLREAGYSRTEATAAVNKGFQVLSQREAVNGSSSRQREAEDEIDVESVTRLIRTITS